MENKVPFTSSEFRVIHLTPESFFKLLIGLLSLLLLNSCSKEALMEPSEPYQELRQWYAFNKMTSIDEPVLWKYTIPFAMPDSSQAYQIPVMSKAGMKDLIIYSENGIQKGFYKLYTPKDETRINIQVLNMFDEVIRDGVLTKTKRVAKAKKNGGLDGSTVREMNVELPDVYCIGQRLPMEGTLADIPIIYSEGGGSYNPSIPSFFSGGGGAPSSDSYDINFDPSEALLFSIGDNVTNKCLIQAINGVINSKYDLGGIVKYFKKPPKTIYFTESRNLPSSRFAQTKAINENETLITLNLNILPSCSNELMALVLYHEIIHAYLGTTKKEVWDNDIQHNTMTSAHYLNLLSEILMKRFPTVSKLDAEALRLTGLEFTPYYINLDSRVQDTVDEIFENFKNKIDGTYCK